MKELVVDDQSTGKILGDSMDDTLSQHSEAEPRTKPLENLKDAFESNLLSLVAGHDADADRRQRNREIACSGKYKPTKEEIQTLLECPRKVEAKRRRFTDGS